MKNKLDSLELAIAEEVWHEKIDGQTTREIADRHNVKTIQALKILKKIVEGQSTIYPFIYEPDYNGVTVGENGGGRIFVGNNQADDGHRPHYVWFFT